MKKILLAAMAFAGMQVAYSQPWIGFDDLSQPIDTNRWTAGSGLLQTGSSGLTMSSSSTNGVVDAGLELNFSLPSNQSWQVTLLGSFDPAYTPLSGGLLESYIAVSSDATWSSSTSSYYANAHQRNSSGYALVPNWILNQGTSGTTLENPTTISSRETLLRLSYDGSRYLSSSYALPGTPQNFTTVDTHDTQAWTGLTEFYLAVGFYSLDTSSAPDDVAIQNVDIVPEPSALSLLAVGLGGLVLFRQGRKKD